MTSSPARAGRFTHGIAAEIAMDPGLHVDRRVRSREMWCECCLVDIIITSAPSLHHADCAASEHLPYVIVIRKRPTGCGRSESVGRSVPVHLREFNATGGRRRALLLPLDLFHFVQTVCRPGTLKMTDMKLTDQVSRLKIDGHKM